MVARIMVNADSAWGINRTVLDVRVVGAATWEQGGKLIKEHFAGRSPRLMEWNPPIEHVQVTIGERE